MIFKSLSCPPGVLQLAYICLLKPDLEGEIGSTTRSQTSVHALSPWILAGNAWHHKNNISADRHKKDFLY